MDPSATHIARLLLEAALAIGASRSGGRLDDGVAVPAGVGSDSFSDIPHEQVVIPNKQKSWAGNGSERSADEPADGA